MRVELSAALFALGAVSMAAVAQDYDQAPKPSKPASAPSFSEAFKGLRDKIKDIGKPATGSSAPDAAAPDRKDSAAPASAAAPAGGAVVKLKEFTPGSKLPAKWNDGHCKNLVEPFGLTDSAMSLGKLKAETEWRSMLGNITGKRAGTTDSRADIRNASRQLNWLPMPVELAIGQKMHDAQNDLMRESKGGKDLYVRARKTLVEVMAQVKEQHPYRFQIFVTSASGGNAESAPGGFIYVDRDLVGPAADAAKTRFVVAHEVSHVLQRHRTRETQMRLSDGVDSMEGLAKLMASTQDSSGALLKQGLDLKRGFVRHSEEQELQADGCAVRLLDAMSRDRTEMIKSINAFVQSLPKPVPAEKPEKVSAEAVFTELSDGKFSRHPSTEQRIKNLNLVLTDLRAGK